MLGVDGLTQERWRQAERKESAIERRQRILAQDLQSNSLSVEDDAGRDVSNLLAQMGRPLTSWDVMRRLKKCNARFHFEYSKSDPTKIGVYLRDKEKTDAGGEVEVLRHICGMEAGIMPEFSVIHKRKKRVANQDIFGKFTDAPNDPRNRVDRDAVKWKEISTFADETRGWRTVLVRLLHARLITEGDVHKQFGWQPSKDSKKWYEKTR